MVAPSAIGYPRDSSGDLDWSMKLATLREGGIWSSVIKVAYSAIGSARDSAGNLDCIMELCSFNSGRTPGGLNLVTVPEWLIGYRGQSPATSTGR